MLIYYV